MVIGTRKHNSPIIGGKCPMMYYNSSRSDRFLQQSFDQFTLVIFVHELATTSPVRETRRLDKRPFSEIISDRMEQTSPVIHIQEIDLTRRNAKNHP